jgi:hypothetical protein
MGKERKRYAQRWVRAGRSGIRKQDARMTVPESVERREFSEPCFMCGVALEPCRHRGVADA